MIKQTLLTLSLLVPLSSALAPAAHAAPQPVAQAAEKSHCCHTDALITGRERGSRVNLRSGPGTNYASRGYGLVGDRVLILGTDYGQGWLWYQVRFPESGAIGWVRSDFIHDFNANPHGEPTHYDY